MGHSRGMRHDGLLPQSYSFRGPPTPQSPPRRGRFFFSYSHYPCFVNSAFMRNIPSSGGVAPRNGDGVGGRTDPTVNLPGEGGSMNLRMSWRKNRPDLEALLRGGFPSFVLQRNPIGLPGGVPVFCYHAASPSVIEADFAFLKENGYETITADEVGVSASDRALILTVDDGAHDLYAVLYPALKQYGFHATAFVASAFHRDAYDLSDASRPCTWDELREMDASGHVNVQAHTHSHRYIPNWPEPLDLVGIDKAFTRDIQREAPGTVKEDLARAKEELESRLKKRVTHLAFPMYTGTVHAIHDGQDLGYETFWWGTLPGRRANKPGDPKTHRVRLSAEFIRRLPGKGRIGLGRILAGRIR